MSYKSSVVTLVDEEARLLALKPIGSEAHAILIDRRCLGMSDEEAVRSEFAHITSGQRCLRLIIDTLKREDGIACLSEDLPQHFGDSLACLMHPEAVRLDYGRTVIDVDDEPRETISFAVHEAVGRIGTIAGADGANEVAREAQTKRSLQATLVEGTINDFLSIEAQQAHCDTSSSEVSRT